jgi:hypothetical protein
MSHRGSCHCGRVAFLVESEIDAAVSCNCSICARKGALLAAVEPERFTLLTSAEESATYSFGSHAIRHRFCRTCGLQPYSENAGDGTLYINLNCVETIDRASLTIIPFDGRAL